MDRSNGNGIPKSDDHEALSNATKLAYKMRRACLEAREGRTNRR